MRGGGERLFFLHVVGPRLGILFERIFWLVKLLVLVRYGSNYSAKFNLRKKQQKMERMTLNFW